MDPHRTSSSGSYRALELMYDGLMELDGNLNPVPCLAERVIQESASVYRFILRRGVRFHSGQTLSTADVTYSIDRLRDVQIASPLRDRFLWIDGFDVVSPLEFRIRLKRPYASFLTLLSRPEAAILPKGQALDFERQSVGTGAFELVRYRPHEGLQLRRNAHYWRAGLPKLDGLDIRFLADNLTRVSALESGEADLISHVPGKEVERLQKRAGIRVIARPSTWFEYIGLNNRRKPLDDARVRRALKLGTDLDALVEVDWFGNAVPVSGWVIPAWNSYGWRAPRVRRDLPAARELLRQAGVPERTRLRLVLNSSVKSTYLPVATVLVSNWAEMGLKLDLVFEDVGLYYADIMAGNYDAILTGSASYVDPEEYLCWFETGHPWNWERFSRPAIDRLLQEARFTAEPARHGLYARVQQELAEDDVPVIPFAWAPAIYAANSRVKDFLPRANFSNRSLAQTWLERN